MYPPGYLIKRGYITNMFVTRFKRCYCYTCEKYFHYLGIAKHRAAHRDKKENCTIMYTHGDTYDHVFDGSKKKAKK